MGADYDALKWIVCTAIVCFAAISAWKAWLVRPNRDPCGARSFPDCDCKRYRAPDEDEPPPSPGAQS